jgi:hypothetical protein
VTAPGPPAAELRAQRACTVILSATASSATASSCTGGR